MLQMSITRYGGENVEFSKQLESLMREKCETKYALAKAIGASQSTVANWLNGKNFPAFRYIGKISEHYDIPISQILEN